jgi:hypothetical protein
MGCALLASTVCGLIACASSAPPSTLEPKKSGDDDDNGSQSQPVASSVASTTPPPAASSVTPLPSSSVPAPVGTVPPINQNCAATTSLLACGQCCFQQNDPLAGCACGPTSKCAQQCGTNMCAGQTPSLECGLCLLTAQCNVQSAFTAGGTGSGLESCMQVSNCEGKGLGGSSGGLFGN